MKKITFLGSTLLLTLGAQAQVCEQEMIKAIPQLEVVGHLGEEADPMGWLTDTQFNGNKTAFFYNGKFIKSMIGLDIKDSTIMDIKREDLKTPLVINGVSYNAKVNITGHRDVQFISLEAIRKEYCPQVTGPVLYMVNKFFIAQDAASYLLDKDFIRHCEIVRSSDVDLFKGHPSFTIVRVFTRIKANSHAVRLR